MSESDSVILEPGESLSMGTRNDDGPRITRNGTHPDEYELSELGPVIYRDEIKRMAEIMGFDVSE